MCMLTQSWLGSNQDPLDSTRASPVRLGLVGSQERLRIWGQLVHLALTPSSRDLQGLFQRLQDLLGLLRRLQGPVENLSQVPPAHQGSASSGRQETQELQVAQDPVENLTLDLAVILALLANHSLVRRVRKDQRVRAEYKVCRGSTVLTEAIRLFQGLLDPKEIPEQAVQSLAQLDGLDIPGLPRPSLVPGGRTVQ